MIVRICGSRALTARGVNAWLTSARRRVCSGGSRNSMVQSARGGAKDACRLDALRLLGMFENRL